MHLIEVAAARHHVRAAVDCGAHVVEVKREVKVRQVNAGIARVFSREALVDVDASGRSLALDCDLCEIGTWIQIIALSLPTIVLRVPAIALQTRDPETRMGENR